VAPEAKIEVIGIRPGEKLHEMLLQPDEARRTVDVGDFYVVAPEGPAWRQDAWKHGKPVPEGFAYASDTNTAWLSAEDMKSMLAGM
jgi:UDP-N-acetylglucosamine 4,6-dehydratase